MAAALSTCCDMKRQQSAKSAFGIPLKCNAFYRVQPPDVHKVSYLTGGLANLYSQIKNSKEEYHRNDKETSYITDENGCFNPTEQVHVPLLAKRYRFIRILGKGCSAVLIEAVDTFRPDTHSCHVRVAIKVLNKKYFALGYQESNNIVRLNQADPHNFSGTVRLLNTFSFGSHFCIVFELLHPKSLHQFFKAIHPAPKRLQLVRKVALRLLQVLGFLQQQNVIHADLKPENILCQSDDLSEGIKVIDFGNAIHCTYEELSLYYDDFELQTLFYRAPEVIFGLSFGPEIDMWSVGCILAELYLGKPLFYAVTKEELLHKMSDVLGPLPAKVFQRGKFYSEYEQYIGTTQSTLETQSKLFQRFGNLRDYHFGSFLLSILQYDPSKRISISDAFLHPFLAPEVAARFLMPTSSKAGGSLYNNIDIPMTTYKFSPAVSADIAADHFTSVDLLRQGTASARSAPSPAKQSKRAIAKITPFTPKPDNESFGGSPAVIGVPVGVPVGVPDGLPDGVTIGASPAQVGEVEVKQETRRLYNTDLLVAHSVATVTHSTATQKPESSLPIKTTLRAFHSENHDGRKQELPGQSKHSGGSVAGCVENPSEGNSDKRSRYRPTQLRFEHLKKMKMEAMQQLAEVHRRKEVGERWAKSSELIPEISKTKRDQEGDLIKPVTPERPSWKRTASPSSNLQQDVTSNLNLPVNCSESTKSSFPRASPIQAVVSMMGTDWRSNRNTSPTEKSKLFNVKEADATNLAPKPVVPHASKRRKGIKLMSCAGKINKNQGARRKGIIGSNKGIPENGRQSGFENASDPPRRNDTTFVSAGNKLDQDSVGGIGSRLTEPCRNPKEQVVRRIASSIHCREIKEDCQVGQVEGCLPKSPTHGFGSSRQQGLTDMDFTPRSSSRRYKRLAQERIRACRLLSEDPWREVSHQDRRRETRAASQDGQTHPAAVTGEVCGESNTRAERLETVDAQNVKSKKHPVQNAMPTDVLLRANSPTYSLKTKCRASQKPPKSRHIVVGLKTGRTAKQKSTKECLKIGVKSHDTYKAPRYVKRTVQQTSSNQFLNKTEGKSLVYKARNDALRQRILKRDKPWTAVKTAPGRSRSHLEKLKVKSNLEIGSDLQTETRGNPTKRRKCNPRESREIGASSSRRPEDGIVAKTPYLSDVQSRAAWEQCFKFSVEAPPAQEIPMELETDTIQLTESGWSSTAEEGDGGNTSSDESYGYLMSPTCVSQSSLELNGDDHDDEVILL